MADPASDLAKPRVCLVCIVKDEGRFLVEWLAHNLALGFDRMFLYDNDSTDATPQIIEQAGHHAPVTRIPWPTRDAESPQLAAYNHALTGPPSDYDWIAFFDCDEFLILRDGVADIHELLRVFAPDVGAVAVNWLNFGSGGRERYDYDLVTETFTLGAARSWSYNRFIKTILRPGAAARMSVHFCVLNRGRYLHVSGKELEMPRPGKATRVNHARAQLNHYQLKSREDFDLKIARGRAGWAPKHPKRKHADPDGYFAMLDRNDIAYDEVLQDRDAFWRQYQRLSEAVAAARG